MQPFITIVMPVRNEVRFIRDTLGQLLGQEYPVDRFEIVVADGMSDDGTREIVKDVARDHPKIRLLDNLKRSSSAGRNVGFRNGCGDFFLVVDGHCYIPDDQLLANLVCCFVKSGADCLGRPQPLDPPGLTLFQSSVALARGSWLGHGGSSLIYSGYEGFCSPVSNGAAYRREVFERIGYVDENFDAAEDVEFNYRVEQSGQKCYTSPTLTVRYYPRESLGELFRQMKRYGMGRHRFLRKHRQAFTINQLIPAVFVAALPLLALSALGNMLSSFWLPLFLIMTSAYCTYVALVVVVAMRLAGRYGWCYFPVLLMIFPAIHCGLGWGFWSVTWMRQDSSAFLGLQSEV